VRQSFSKPLSAGKSSLHKMSSGRKELLHRLRGLEIRSQLLENCEVLYDGWQEDVESNNQQLREVRERLEQVAA